MWTPRRILLLILGAGLCTVAFLIYNRFLGWIDGLPALPERYLVAVRPGQPLIAERNEDRAKQMLRRAFGDGCLEVDYAFQMRLPHGLILAFHRYKINDGAILLWPLSLASIGKVNPQTGFPEINTVHCDEAIIRFDKKIVALSDISGSKMIAADFLSNSALAGNDPRRGHIHVVHNHATPQVEDDLHVKARGPVYFEDSAGRSPDRPQLWTDQSLEITDHQTRPPNRIKANTFNVFLEPDALKTGDQTTRASGRRSGVRRIELGNVLMLLYVEQSSNFLASAAARPTSGEKSLLSIQTAGLFAYDARTNQGEFTIPAQKSNLRHYVKVARLQPEGNDELDCDRLDLQFRRRNDPPGTQRQASGVHGGGHEIVEARATGDAVVLTSIGEKLNARGTELVFRQDRREAVLRGAPMIAIKEGNRIEAPELLMHRPDPSQPQTGSIVTLGRARGPGKVYLHESKEQRTIEARWSDDLLIEREHDRERITLNGSAVFEDRANGQWLRGDQIRIWMLPSAKGQLSVNSTRARPARLQVAGHVAAQTPGLIIDETSLLDMFFNDVDQLPDGRSGPALTVAARPTPTPGPRLLAPDAAVAGGPPAASTVKKPIQLSAHSIETMVHRCGKDLSPDRVFCRTRVHVRQNQARPGERGLDIRAQELDLTHHADGDVLLLTGSSREAARVEINELNLSGPRINFDQRDNRVKVDGAGQAVLQTSSNLNGEKLDRPTEVKINWGGHMVFQGNRISFHGGVRAEQEATRFNDNQGEKELNRLLCPHMDVYLNRAVSFSQFHKAQAAGAHAAAGEKPHIRRVVCHRGDDQSPPEVVSVSGHLWRDGRLARFHQIDCPEVTFDNDASEVTAVCTGGARGEMRLFQLGDNETPSLSEKPLTRPAAEQVYHLTRISFSRQLRANNRSKSAQSINFVGRVLVAHAPATDPELRIDIDRLPDGAFTLNCQALEVLVKNENGRRHNEMRAEGNAAVRANDFSGHADVIKYDEAKKKQVIFDSKDGNTALLNYVKVKGKPGMDVNARTIYYWRESNSFQISGGVVVTGLQ